MSDDVTTALTETIAPAMGWNTYESGEMTTSTGQYFCLDADRPAIMCELLMPALDVWHGYKTCAGYYCEVTVDGVMYVNDEAADTPHDAFILAFAALIDGGWKP